MHYNCMNIIEINSVNRASTGSIMKAVADYARSRGHSVMVCYPDQRDNRKAYREGDYLIGNRYLRNIGVFICRYFRYFKYAHAITTACFIRRLKTFKPDVIHIHNLHPSYLNLYMLFKYANKNNVKVVITQHDCWLYTGHCPHYTDLGCNKWKSGCESCKVYMQYPISKWDDSSYMFEQKKRLLLSLKDLTLVPVSQWLGNEDKKSFLKDSKICTISNGINLSIFKPTVDDTYLKKCGIGEEFLIMGCATDWGYRKGLYDYLKFSTMLHQNEKIILVGMPEGMLIDKPDNVIIVNRTENPFQLAALYTRANVLLSLSKEETFGLTIVEAMACGTPAVVYNNTAQPELINGRNGIVVPNGDINAVRQGVDEIKKWIHDVAGDCVDFAKRYDQNAVYDKYVNLMENM